MNAKTKLLRKMETKESIEQERNLLKITLDHLARDNESLKECLEDMRSTAIANKQLLNEYVETVTGKDLMVEKLRHTILQLQNRIQTLEDYIKMNQIENNRVSVSHRGNLTPRLGSSSNKFVFDYSKANHTSRFEDKNGYQTERISRVLNVNKSNAKTEPDVKEFYHKQTKLHEELSNLKSEMQNIAESISIPKNLNKADFVNVSDISSEESSANIKRILNFKDKFDEENLTKLRDLLNSTHEESSILLLVTDKNEFWELIKRSDITTDSLSDPKSIQSLPYDIFKNGIKLKLETEHNINNDSINNSDFDLSQISDFNISSLIKDTENQVSDNS